MCSGDDIKDLMKGNIFGCCIIDIRFNYSLPQLLVKIWLLESQLPTDVQALPSLNPSTYGRVIGVRGVMHSNWLHWKTAVSVLDCAYVMHCNSLLSGMYENMYSMKMHTSVEMIYFLCFFSHIW